MHNIIPLLLAAAVVFLVVRTLRKSNKSRPTGALPPVEKTTLETPTTSAPESDAGPDVSILQPAPAAAHDHANDQEHDHSPPEGSFAADESDFHPVHHGKNWKGGCKFDPAEVRRTRNFATPKIDTSNLPAPDARIVNAFKVIDIARIKDTMLKLTGELPVTVNGVTSTLATRNTHSKELDIAMGFIEAQYAAMGLKTVRDPYTVRGKKLNNLVIELPGKTNPSRVVFVGAHLDSTAGSPWGNEKVAPGADDDGSGTAGMLELARALKDLDLPFTVRLIHFTGEEQGLWGSYAYSDKVAAAKTDVVAMVEIDMISYCAKPGNRLDIHDDIDQNGSHELTVRFFRAIKRYGINLTPVDTHNNAVKDRSDHAGFLDHGYKAVLVSEEFTDDGFNPNYHTVNDRVKNCNLPYMVEVLKAVTAVVAELADLK
jgi:hypothetical protein